MFFTTEPTQWENDDGVMESLVFPTPAAYADFKSAYEDPSRQKTAAGFPDANGLGVLFKLRAVRTFEGTWLSLVRSGADGSLIWEGSTRYSSYQSAIVSAFLYVKEQIQKTVVDFSAKVYNDALAAKAEKHER